MAKNTSQSKAKTKTAKKPTTAKSAAKTTTKTTNKSVKPAAKAAKTTKTEVKKPVVSKEGPAAKAAKASKSSVLSRLVKVTSVRSISQMHAVSALIFVALAATAGLVMKAAAYPLAISYVTKDELASKATTVLGAAQQVLFNLDLRWVVVGLMGISAVFSLLRMTALSASEDKGIKVRIQPWRWVDFAITGAVMTGVVAVLYGAQDVVSLGLFGALTVFSLVLAWIAERENSGANTFVKGAYLASVLSALLVLAGLATYGWATTVYGIARYAWYGYAAFGTLVASAALIGLNQRLGFARKKNWDNYLFVERNYLLLNLVVKAAFAVILIVGLKG